jgi:hypothetical protein
MVDELWDAIENSHDLNTYNKELSEEEATIALSRFLLDTYGMELALDMSAAQLIQHLYIAWPGLSDKIAPHNFEKVVSESWLQLYNLRIGTDTFEEITPQ